MKLTNHSAVPVYTISGSSTARPLPDWLIRKRKRSLKQDPEFANRIELLQDFEFEEASSCVRVSEDGDWVMSTGTYKPQIHVHYLPHLSLSYARHTDALNQTFRLLSSDYSKSIHLQSDRFIEFHTPGSCHYRTRIPRYGRDLIYDKRSAEALVPAVGVNGDGNGEVFRLNLELGRFMKGYEVDVGGDDFNSAGGGALQGGINTGAVNTAAVAEESHNLLAFGTSLGTVEFWDSRSRSRVSVLGPPQSPSISYLERPEITALSFHRSGLTLATGTSTGLIHTYDMRSPLPLLKKDQGYGYPIKSLLFLNPPTSEPKILSADKRIIKVWDQETGLPWTSVEPAVDLNHVECVPNSGMILTANEGKQQHSFFIPQLGPAPRWCAFLDNLVEEMAEDPNDPHAFGGQQTGAVYDNYKFLTLQDLKSLNLDHLIGTTSLLRPYMHGWFVQQRLYEEARLISNPELWREQRQKSIQERIDKERESRIRGNKKVSVKVNKRLVERMVEREEKNERRKAKRVLARGGDDDMLDDSAAPAVAAVADGAAEEERKTRREPAAKEMLSDPRFAKLFQDEDYEVDEMSREFRDLNPSTTVTSWDKKTRLPKGLTAAEEEQIEREERRARAMDSSDESSSEDEEEEEAQRQKIKNDGRISNPSYRKSGHKPKGPQMVVSSSNHRPQPRKMDRSFGSRAAGLKERRRDAGVRDRDVVGEKEVTFAPTVKKKGSRRDANAGGGGDRVDRRRSGKDRRSASGNVFRRM